MFLLVATGMSVVAVVTAHLPLPQIREVPLGEHARDVAFSIDPLLGVPAMAAALVGTCPQHEYFGVRKLVAFRVVLSLSLSLVSYVALVPAALTQPVPHAFGVLGQTLLTISGLTLLLACWVPPTVSWLPVWAMGFLGVMTPGTGALAWLAPISRDFGIAHLAMAGLVWVLSVVVYSWGHQRWAWPVTGLSGGR